jgi:hypothetical protein
MVETPSTMYAPMNEDVALGPGLSPATLAPPTLAFRPPRVGNKVCNEWRFCLVRSSLQAATPSAKLSGQGEVRERPNRAHC